MATQTTLDVAHDDRKRSIHIDAEALRRMSINNPNLETLSHEAQNATNAEHELGLRQSLKLYPKAIAWSIFLSTCVVMEGFDITLITGLFAYPAFQRKFGVEQPNGSFELTAAWQSGLTNGMLVGQILGLFINGIVAERLGYRYTLVGSLGLVAAFIFIIFFAETLVQLLIGEILIGVPWGAFQTLTVTYASEVCPIHLRAYLTTYVNLCWVIGQFIASGVLRAMVERDDKWGYKIPFALQWIWPVPLAIGIWYAPESPWWLVRKGRLEDAKRSVLRLTSRNANPDFNADESVSMMVHTNELEKAVSEGTSYLDCFKGIDLRRTEIVCASWGVQTLCGSTFMGYSTYFYQQAGLAVEASFSMSLGQYALGAVGTLSSWFLMRWFGRRTLYLSGQLIMLVLLMTIGFASLASRDNASAQGAIGSLLLVYTLTYNCTTLLTANMRFSSIFVPVATLAGLITQVSAQLAPIQAALVVIEDSVDAYGAAFTAGTAAGIQSADDDLLASINAAIPVVNASPNLSLFDAISLATSIRSVQTAVDAAFDIATAQKPAVDALGITADVLAGIQAQRAAVATLGAALVSKVPSIVQGTAQVYVNDILAILDDAIAIYSA
ncbi:hypothetical protein BN1708_008131 [Verticillium longisporum]|uniref:Major facilitator superfamily (MFS) profile domain-containing protein n=2 Tax=Verticillium longisporum TaxID=100787 RepID=A0A0G4N1G8_VERLO|nr:hypothetical protein BN1708_008131 [Verticillium longisporum]